MFKAKKMVSAVLLVCFILNTVVSDLAFGLAVPSSLSGIVDIRLKDIVKIKLALEAQLIALEKKGPANSDMDSLQPMIEGRHFAESTMFDPTDMQFFRHKPKIMNAEACVRVRLIDKYGPRDYYAVFAFKRDAQGGFPIKVYTEKQYEDSKGFTAGILWTKSEDAQEIDKYAQNEKGIDRILDWAHNSVAGNAAKAAAKLPAEKFDFPKVIVSLQKLLNVSITNPHDKRIVPDIEDRQFSIVNLDAIRANMPGFNEKDLQDARAFQQ